jgi:hypothetical protein
MTPSSGKRWRGGENWLILSKIRALRREHESDDRLNDARTFRQTCPAQQVIRHFCRHRRMLKPCAIGSCAAA